MKIAVETHNEILIDPIIEIGERTIDDAKSKTFTPMIVIVDKENQKRRFAQYLPPQPYVNGTWTDEDVEKAITKHIDEIKID